MAGSSDLVARAGEILLSAAKSSAAAGGGSEEHHHHLHLPLRANKEKRKPAGRRASGNMYYLVIINARS
jgi:hypothetical protein